MIKEFFINWTKVQFPKILLEVEHKSQFLLFGSRNLEDTRARVPALFLFDGTEVPFPNDHFQNPKKVNRKTCPVFY